SVPTRGTGRWRFGLGGLLFGLLVLRRRALRLFRQKSPSRGSGKDTVVRGISAAGGGRRSGRRGGGLFGGCRFGRGFRSRFWRRSHSTPGRWRCSHSTPGRGRRGFPGPGWCG